MRSKTKNLITSLTILFLFLMIGTKSVQGQQTSVSFQIFYDQLAPYGEWVDDPDYGYVWLPQVSQDFQPYATNGYWVNTQYGNTWYSNYDWGWAPFHYGRWIYTDYYGWAWIPGYEWGPAWVSWRQGGGQYGWAPLGPGISFSLNINIPLRHWVFVPQRYFFNNNIYRYYTPFRNYSNFYNRTTIINNVYVYNNRNYYSGPDRRSLEKATRNRVSVREVRNNTRPGRGTINSNSVALYRPNINTENNKNARPARAVSSDNVITRSNRVNGNIENLNRSRPTRATTTGVESGNPTSNRATRGNSRQAVRSNNEPTPSSNNRPNRTTTVTSRETTAPETKNVKPATIERVTREAKNNNNRVVPNSHQTNQGTRRSSTSVKRENAPSRREVAPSSQRTNSSTRRVSTPAQRQPKPVVSSKNTRNGNNHNAGNNTSTRNGNQNQRNTRTANR